MQQLQNFKTKEDCRDFLCVYSLAEILHQTSFVFRGLTNTPTDQPDLCSFKEAIAVLDTKKKRG